MIAKAWWFSILIALLIISWTWWWAQQTRTVNLVNITTSTEAPHLIPVYAQFDITQTVTVPTLSQVTSIQLPLVMPAQPSGEVVVDLQANDRLLERWHLQLGDYMSQANQTVRLTLPLQPSRLLEGKVAVRVSAPQLDAHFPTLAPQVLVEDDDQGYPDGNYRIAHNQKKGDLDLTVMGTQTNWLLCTMYWRQHLDQAVITILRWLFLGLLGVTLPLTLLPSRVAKVH